MGVLGAGLEALRRSAHYGAKRNYQNWIGVIPYQTYIFIHIILRKKTIQNNEHFEGSILLPCQYGVPIIMHLYSTHTTRNSYNMFIQHANTTRKPKN